MQKFLDRLLNLLSRFLPRKIVNIAQPFFTVSFIVFITIGVVNTLSTALISSLLDIICGSIITLSECTAIKSYNLTFIAGYILSMLISFLLNCRFTFKEKPTIGKLIRFPVSYIPNFIIQYAVVGVLTSFTAVPKTSAYLFAAVIGIPVTFITMKIFVFKRK